MAKASVCPRCGTREEDWKDPETGFSYLPPLIEIIPFRCTGCAESERIMTMVPKGQTGITPIAVPYDPEADPWGMNDGDDDLDEEPDPEFPTY